MGFEFDVSRNAINRQKNGVDFEEEQGHNLNVGFLKTALAANKVTGLVDVNQPLVFFRLAVAKILSKGFYKGM